MKPANMATDTDRIKLGLPLGKEYVAQSVALCAARQERELERQCENLLRLRGIVFRHERGKASKGNEPGWPDLTFAVRGIPYAVELKARGGAVTREQQEMLYRMAVNGWRVQVVYGYDAFSELVEKATQEERRC